VARHLEHQEEVLRDRDRDHLAAGRWVHREPERRQKEEHRHRWDAKAVSEA